MGLFVSSRECFHIITYTFQLKGTTSGLSLRDSSHENTVRIAGKSQRMTQKPTDYENVPICYFRVFFVAPRLFPYRVTRLYMLRRSEVGLEAKLSETTFLR